jgi:hypothetical protein
MSEHRKWAYFWSLFAQLVWVIAAIQFYFFAKIDLPGLQDIFGAHASYVLMISLPLVFIVLPYWLLKNPPAASDRPNSEPVSVEIYDKGKLPVLGRLIELTLLPETNSKNKKWVGFFYAADTGATLREWAGHRLRRSMTRLTQLLSAWKLTRVESCKPITTIPSGVHYSRRIRRDMSLEMITTVAAI